MPIVERIPAAKPKAEPKPVAWIHKDHDSSTPWQQRVVATNEQYVRDVGVDNFVPLYK